eukprot:g3437.t1
MGSAASLERPRERNAGRQMSTLNRLQQHRRDIIYNLTSRVSETNTNADTITSLIRSTNANTAAAATTPYLLGRVRDVDSRGRPMRSPWRDALTWWDASQGGRGNSTNSTPGTAAGAPSAVLRSSRQRQRNPVARFPVCSGCNFSVRMSDPDEMSTYFLYKCSACEICILCASCVAKVNETQFCCFDSTSDERNFERVDVVGYFCHACESYSFNHLPKCQTCESEFVQETTLIYQDHRRTIEENGGAVPADVVSVVMENQSDQNSHSQNEGKENNDTVTTNAADQQRSPFFTVNWFRHHRRNRRRRNRITQLRSGRNRSHIEENLLAELRFLSLLLDAHRQSLRAALQNSLNDGRPVANPAPTRFLERIKNGQMLLNKSCKDLECSVCLEMIVGNTLDESKKKEIDADKRGVQLPCGHCFHAKCIHTWLSWRNSCPVCRENMKNDKTEEKRSVDSLSDDISPPEEVIVS